MLAGFNEIPEPLPAVGDPKSYSRGDDDCVYPLVDFGKTWMADDVQVMDRDRASVFIGYGGYENPPPVVVYWWD